MKYELPVNYNEIHYTERKLVRNQYVQEQDGKCYFCKGKLDELPPIEVANKEIDWGLFPRGFMNNPIHLQHCHKTNMTEGAVHAKCNAVMWQYHGI